MPKRSYWFRFAMFGLLYFVQGSALAYFRNFQKPYLDGFQVDADLIGLLTTLLLLPFILKVFIGMLSDRVNLFGAGHRKPYIMVGLILAAIAFGLAAFTLPDANFTLFAAFIILGSFSVALFDSATDGLAIDITPENEQGRIQSVMVGGRALGFIVLSLVFGSLLQGSDNYKLVFLIVAGAMLIPLLLVLQVKEPKERGELQQFEWRAFGELLKPRFLVFGAYAVMYSLVSFGVDGLVTFFMSHSFDATAETIGTYGSLRGLGAVIGAVAAGWLLDRMGRRPIAFGAVIVVSVGAVIIGTATQVNILLVMGILWGIAWGFQETIFVALAMELSDSRIAAFMFALMMALSNIGTAIGDGVATGLTDNLAFSTVFLLLVAINVVNFPILWGLFKVAPELQQRAFTGAEANA